MNVLVVVFADFVFLLLRPCSKWFLEVSLTILAADHEANLTRRISWDSGVGVLDVREDLSAVSFQLGD